MAHAAVVSLKQTINRLPKFSHIISRSSNLELIHKSLTSLQQVLEKSDDSCTTTTSRKRLNALDAEIKETVQKLEDLLEFEISNHFLSEPETHGIEELSHSIDSLMETMNKKKEEFVNELENSVPDEEEEEEDANAATSHRDFGVKMVGLSKEFNHIKSKLVKGVRPDEFGVFSFVGMAGSGRSMIAKTIFEHIYNGREQSLDCGARVTIGPRYQRRETLLAILDQVMGPSSSEGYVLEGDDELLIEKVNSSLKGRKYMIVIDDIWETRVWDDLRRSFPEQSNGSLILITTSFEEVALYADCCRIFQIPVLDEDRTWDVLQIAIFGVGSSCSRQTEESGRMIARNCRGRMFSFAKVVLFMLKAEKNQKMQLQACWNAIAQDKEHPVFLIPDELLEVDKIGEDIQLLSDFCLGNNKRTSAMKMVVAGLNSNLSYNSLEQFKMHMFPDYTMPEIEFMSVLGMAGIGKTTLAKEIFEDKSVLDHFEHRVWITLGPKYQSKEILVDILAQIYPSMDKVSMRGDEALTKELCAELSNKRCLIVLDDVWNTETLRFLDDLFKKSKAKVLVTTRLAYVARIRPIYKIVVRMQLLNKEESWSLLCQKVFAEGSCPHALERAGKRISENCDGLPLLILILADHLSKAEKNVEYWNEVAYQKLHHVFKNAHDEISKSLVPSYESLSQHLRACFLYMGVFRQNHEISTSRIIKLWDAEGFLEPKQSENVEDFAENCLNELVDNSVVMTCERSYYSESETFRLHSVFWHLSNTEAAKSNFFHSLDTFGDTSIEGMEKQRRLCIHNSTLLGIKEVHDAITAISATRSLLCTAPPHQYPVTVDFGLRLLRVMDALTIRLYEFPDELVGLIHLRYLALTCSGPLPASISNLRILQYLIVGEYLSIKSTDDSLRLPAEIWDMKELKHLHVTGRSLTSPQCGVILPNLSTLLDVSAQSCTYELFKGIPNLKTLGIRIELDPDDDGSIPFAFLDNVSGLSNLESLECAVVNPEFRAGIGQPRPTPIQIFPSGLRKLSLSGLGYPWEHMRVIGELKKLQVLELRCFAFQGARWAADAYSFGEVQYLLLEDIDLVRWELGRFSFKNIEFISIKHCYGLEGLPRNFSSTLGKIEVVDCNVFVMKWAEEVKEVDLNNMHISRAFLDVEAQASWVDATKLNSK
ncbi:late blight resistance protein R1-A-like [Salvia splendens]|uniref:late blight resistance protein R1-A-like n=1 Tax=Salvia splendens TaxID=180675 RepID=UPI001C25C450|nr:late blight resistance protein R1-A-like [Salvia splendens]